jgi:hypothetical protein
MVFAVADSIALQAFKQRHFPHGETLPVPDDSGPIPPRSEAIALHRDAKRALTTTGEPVLLRAVCDVTASRGVDTVNLCHMTRLTGAACLLIGQEPAWHLEEAVAIVENLEAFLHFERLSLKAAVALYAGGRLSRRVLDWLASDSMSRCTFIHCGDYDPVGLDEYLRLRTRLDDRVTLHVPDNLTELFERYGKRELLRDSEAILARLRHGSDRAVRTIVNLMDTSGCGLEQEALLLRESV